MWTSFQQEIVDLNIADDLIVLILPRGIGLVDTRWHKQSQIIFRHHHCNYATHFLSSGMGAAPSAKEALSVKVGEVDMKCSSAVQLQILWI